jgi:aquaporin Z
MDQTKPVLAPVEIVVLITKHITKLKLIYYFTAEILGALLGSLFVMVVIGNEANGRKLT